MGRKETLFDRYIRYHIWVYTDTIHWTQYSILWKWFHFKVYGTKPRTRSWLGKKKCLSSKRRKNPHRFLPFGKKLRFCNTSEMTLGRVLGLDLGILFDFEDHGERVAQSFESATCV